MSSDRLNGDRSNNLIDEYIEENDVFAMEVDVDEYCDKHVGLLVVSSVDSDSDHGGDVASLSNFSESDCDSFALTDVPEENDDFLEDIDDGLVIIRADYGEIGQVQEELANPLENQVEVGSNPSLANVDSLLGDSIIESIVDEEDLVNNFEENEEELDANQVELANPVANEEQIEELGTNVEEEQIEANQVEVASENSLAGITDLPASSFKYSSEDVGWIQISDDDDSDEDMAEDVDEEVFVDDDVTMIDLVSNPTSESSAEENVNVLTAVVLPTVSVSSSDSSELRRNNIEQFLQSAPVASTPSDSAPSLTPSEDFNFRISIQRTRLCELRRESAELQARMDEHEIAAAQLDVPEVAAEQPDVLMVAAEQQTGYGILEGNLDYIPDIEGVLPRLPSYQLTSNWLTNVENHF